jgi:hypothetical protein
MLEWSSEINKKLLPTHALVIGWLTCIPAVLLPHSPCRFMTANAPANRQMPIASVVTNKLKKKEENRLW